MNIAVYCSSQNELPQEVVEFALQAGHWIGSHGHTLVYGGVNAGLMHVTAQAVHDRGGRVLGVIPEIFNHRADPLCDELVLTRDLNDRKSRMHALSQAFVVLPGGLGTIDEWVSTLSQLKVDDNREAAVIVCNHRGMYDPLIAQLQATARSIYSQGKYFPVSTFVTSPQELINKLNNITSNNEK